MVMLAGALLSAASYTMEKNRIEETQDTLQEILDAIDAYHDDTTHPEHSGSTLLPCPAGEREYSDDDFGIAEGTNQDTAACATRCDAPNLLTADSGRVVAGTVPVISLNIDPRLILDGWNRRITYVVDSYLTCEDGSGSGPGYSDTAAGSVTVQNAGGSTITSTAAIVLISHGRNGHGAWAVRSGTRLFISSPGTAEDENAHVGGTYDSIFVQAPIHPDFDDIVLYQTKWYFQNND